MSPSQRPNILLIVSDEERRNDWLDTVVHLPAHQRLRDDGLSFERHYTHSSPCSPSRASLFSGQYLAQHGVVDNVSFPAHTALDPAVPTIGSMLRAEGYESGYVGRWHLSHSAHPPMADYGYSGWEGNDYHFTGAAWTGRHFDPVIVDQAEAWLDSHQGGERPWFLTVALVNPHDIMWFPIDQPSHQAANPADAETFEFIRNVRVSGVPLTPVGEDYPRRFDVLPTNFDDDLHTKPEIQRAWRHVRNREHFVGAMDPADTGLWLRQLDYYAYLHEELDHSLARLLGVLDRLGIYEQTSIVYTSDHGDACGSHGLRAKLPCVYEEVMGVPLVVKSAGVKAGRHTAALSTHVDLAATVAGLGGVDVADSPTLAGKDLGPILADPTSSVRDHVFFSQDSAQSELLRNSRYAVRGFFDGETKYARYYGVGGGIDRAGRPATEPKTYDVDADFDDQDHEWYELREDPPRAGQPGARQRQTQPAPGQLRSPPRLRDRGPPLSAQTCADRDRGWRGRGGKPRRCRGRRRRWLRRSAGPGSSAEAPDSTVLDRRRCPPQPETVYPRRCVVPFLIVGVFLLASCGNDGEPTSELDGAADSGSPADEGDGDDNLADDSDTAAGSEQEGDAPDSSDGTAASSGGSGTAVLQLANGDSYEFSVLCMLETQEAAGSEILFTLVSYDDPLNLDVTQFGDDSFGGAASVSVYDSDTYDIVWEATSLAGTEISLRLEGNTVTGRGVFLPAGDTDAEGVEGELAATC